MSFAVKGANTVVFVETAVTSGTGAFNHQVFPGANRRVVIPKRRGTQAKAVGMAGFIVHTCHVQQGFGWNVAPVRRVTTKGVFLYNCNALSSPSGNGSGCASGGAASDNDEVIVECVFCFCHGVSLECRSMMFV